MPTLETDQIVLRAPEPTDIDLLYSWENDVSIWESGCSIRPFSKFTLNKYLETAHLDIFEAHQLRLMIEVKESSKIIGSIDLFDFDSFHNRAGIGILIASKEDRRKGYASQALKLTIDYVFNILGMNQIFCNIAAQNTASLALFQKSNFEIIGLKKQWTRRGNKYEDEYLLQLLNPQSF